MSRLAIRSSVAATAAALVLSACGGGGTPQSQLEEAAASTADTSFAYEFTVNADEQALQALGPDGAQASGFLQSFLISGVRSGEAMELRVGLLGFDVLEVRQLAEDEIYLRVGIQDLAGLAGAQPGDLAAAVVPSLEQAGLSPEVIAAVGAALNGQWVGVQGEVDQEAIQDALGVAPTVDPSEQQERAVEALGGDIQGFVEQYVEVVDVQEEDARRVFDVNIRLRELFRSLAAIDPSGQVEDLEADLAQLPEQVGGTVATADGLIELITIDVAEAIREAGGQVEGAVELRLELSEHGAVEEITAPDDVTTITGEQLSEALAALFRSVGGMRGFTPGATASPSPTPTS